MQIRFLLILFFCFISFPCLAEYSINGKLNLKGEWQNIIYLATIDKLDDYYSAKAEHIINMANIASDGTFVLKGENLPEHAQFYKLYLVREEHSEFNACLYVGGENHNFIHIILTNDTHIEIQADQTTYAPFGDYTISGDADNMRMKTLSRLVYPSYEFYEIRFPSELQFSQNKLNKDLFHFADTCTSTLVSLAALNNTDFDAYYQTHIDAYKTFKNELKTANENHPYTNNYIRKLRYYSDEDLDKANIIWKLLTCLLSVFSLGLLYKIHKLRSEPGTQENANPKFDATNYTQRELKILDLILKGKSNKAIAVELFIELSTVKSHINKLYSKMGVSNRQEAKRKASSWTYDAPKIKSDV